MKKSLTIAGFDPSGGAGIQADLKVFQSLGVYGLSAVAALTAQNTKGVEAVQAVDCRFLRKQLEVLVSDIKPDSTKIGMLLSVDNVKTVSSLIRRKGLKHIVLDPVFISSSGKRLAERQVPRFIRERLLPICSVITPNIHEAAVLSGFRIDSANDMMRAAEALKLLGPEAIIITGGHAAGNADDLFYDGSFHFLEGKRHAGEFHGTGCTFSSAVAACLALGMSNYEASKKAKNYISKAFSKAFEAGHGMKVFDIRPKPIRK